MHQTGLTREQQIYMDNLSEKLSLPELSVPMSEKNKILGADLHACAVPIGHPMHRIRKSLM